MEYVILSSDEIMKCKLRSILIECMTRRNIDLFNVSIILPKNINEFKSVCSKHKKVIAFVDISTGKTLGYDWIETVKFFSKKYKNVYFVLISNEDVEARIIFKHGMRVIYFINSSEEILEEEISKITEKLIKENKDKNQSIYIWNDLGNYVKISYKDILFIETIKGTHRCTVVHRNGTGTLKVAIHRLKSKLDSRFVLCRPSTIANIDNVSEVDFKNNIFYFNNKYSCSFSRSNKKRIKEIIKKSSDI